MDSLKLYLNTWFFLIFKFWAVKRIQNGASLWPWQDRGWYEIHTSPWLYWLHVNPCVWDVCSCFSFNLMLYHLYLSFFWRSSEWALLILYFKIIWTAEKLKEKYKTFLYISLAHSTATNILSHLLIILFSLSPYMCVCVIFFSEAFQRADFKNDAPLFINT